MSNLVQKIKCSNLKTSLLMEEKLVLNLIGSLIISVLPHTYYTATMNTERT